MESLEEKSLSMLPEAKRLGETMALVLERSAARLGPDACCAPWSKTTERNECVVGDRRPATGDRRPAPHRAPDAGRSACRSRPSNSPSRCVWPFRTTGRSDRGVLRLLAGPHRVEGGCCDRTTSIEAVKKRAASPTVPPLETTSHVAQDDWVVVSEQAGVL